MKLKLAAEGSDERSTAMPNVVLDMTMSTIELETPDVIESPRVTHLRFRVAK